MQNTSGVLHTLRAAHNISIDLGAHSWRLFNGAQHPEQPGRRVALLEATTEKIHYTPAFARARKLSRLTLSPADVARVVVGWAPETNTWHLGLLLAAQPETSFRMRWCSLASWPSGAAHDHMAAAKQAGQALAQIIDRPLHVVAPPVEPPPVHGDTQPVQATTPMESPGVYAAPAPAARSTVEDEARAKQPDLALKLPPFEFEAWVLRRNPRGLAWVRRSRWVWMGTLRIVGLLLLAGFYLFLGVGSQTSGLAAVKPDWLPWMGVLVAGFLMLSALFYLGQLLLSTGVVIDTTTYEVQKRRRFSGRVCWRVPFNQINYVLVSQTPARAQGLRRKQDHTPISQDMWLHISDGARFYEIATLESVEGQSRAWDTARSRQRIPGRRVLRLAEYDTPAHHAAYVMAELLGTAVWLDIRQ